jgi:hypothetical protein
MYVGMTATHQPAGAAPAPQPDGGEGRRDRIAREARSLDEARASAEQGRTVSEALVDAWLDSLGGENELAPPRSGV